ncbi:MAG: hypothetical protein IE925_10040 [Rhodobacterales bacterium]|nr:hypothetical protein [Rhodobacterales bacterium]
MTSILRALIAPLALSCIALPAAAWCNGDTLESPTLTLREIEAESGLLDMCGRNWYPSCDGLLLSGRRPVLDKLNDPALSGCITEARAPAVAEAVETLMARLAMVSDQLEARLTGPGEH